MNQIVGINQGAVMQTRLEPFLHACHRYGVREVELRAPKIIEALYHLTPQELRERLAQAEVTVTAVNSLDDFALVPDENLSMLEREAQTMAYICDVVQCDLVVAPVGRWFDPKPVAWEWVRQRSAQRLQVIEHVLTDHNIRIGVEPIAFPNFTVTSLEGAMEIISEAGSRNAVLIADVYNLMLGSSTPDSMRALAQQIGMIHVNDSPHRRGAELDVMFTRLFPQEGVLNPKEWVQLAWEGGYTGPVSLEIFMKSLWEDNPDAALKLCAEKAAAFAADLEQLKR